MAMKVMAPGIEHKSDVGGVRLNVGPEEAGSVFDQLLTTVAQAKPDSPVDGVLMQPMAEDGIELIVGAVRDSLFGPAVMLGAGGVLVELMKDVVFRFAPLTLTDATGMLERLRSRALLDGFRGHAAVNRARIVDVLLRVSRLMQDRPEILELDINPLVASGERALAIDCRVRLRAVQMD
jgi:acetyl-CoA synthetase (ADP-forming)